MADNNNGCIIDMLLEAIMFIKLHGMCVGEVFVYEQETQIKATVFIQGQHL